MARYIFQGVHRDGNGRVILSGTCSVFLAGTTTPADVYAASVGGTAINSVSCSPTDGSFLFWVDDGTYSLTQRFKIVLSKANYTTATYDYIFIYPSLTISLLTGIQRVVDGQSMRNKGIVGGIAALAGPGLWLIDTEGGAATDDLDTVTGLNAGEYVTLRITNNARVITIKHGAHIKLQTSADLVLSNVYDQITFDCTGADILVEDTRAIV